MIEAGYSEAQSKNPNHILDSETIQEGISDFIRSLDDKRKQALTHLTEDKLEKAPAREIAYVMDILNKNHLLLSGGDTERTKITISVDGALVDKYETDPGANTNSKL
jgi:hypothetical protein